MKPSSIGIKNVINTPLLKNTFLHPINMAMDISDKSNSPLPDKLNSPLPDKTYTPSVNTYGANYSSVAYKNNTNSLHSAYLEKMAKEAHDVNLGIHPDQ